ncbi:MAG: prephenate dehydrogenase [Bordetella sp.]|nr:MAG: prephenate dehydrogenase [Bordetella sp.]
MTRILPSYTVSNEKLRSDSFVPILAIVGVGLIGGSFAAALRFSNKVGQIFGIDKNVESLRNIKKKGLIDEIVSLEIAAKESDLILLSTPIGNFESIFKKIRPHLKTNTIITDVGSTKAEVMKMARRILGKNIKQFVPGHPIAGAELSGADSAKRDLFKNRNVVLTPFKENRIETLKFVREVWQACGANILNMEAKEHDYILASVSHIPHFLSAVYMSQVTQSSNSSDRLLLAGSGFRDFTRISAGSVEIWKDIFLSNCKALKIEMNALRKVLKKAEKALYEKDKVYLESLLEKAAKARRNWANNISV